MLDMSHHINKLNFGEERENDEEGTNSLAGFNSEKEIQEVFMGITYTYFLDIMERNVIDENSDQGQ